MKQAFGAIVALTLALGGCQGSDERSDEGGGGGPNVQPSPLHATPGGTSGATGGGGGPAPSPMIYGPTGGAGDAGGPAMGGMDPDGIGPGNAPAGGGGGGTATGSAGQVPPAGTPDEDPNVNPINQSR